MADYTSDELDKLRSFSHFGKFLASRESPNVLQTYMLAQFYCVFRAQIVFYDRGGCKMGSGLLAVILVYVFSRIYTEPDFACPTYVNLKTLNAQYV